MHGVWRVEQCTTYPNKCHDKATFQNPYPTPAKMLDLISGIHYQRLGSDKIMNLQGAPYLSSVGHFVKYSLTPRNIMMKVLIL